MPGGDGSQHDGRGGALVGGFVDDHQIVLAEAVVEREHPTTHALRQPANGFAAVLRVLGQRGPGLRGVAGLRHVEGHECSSFLPPQSRSGFYPFPPLLMMPCRETWCDLPRIPLPRTWVNKGKNKTKGRG